MEGITKNLSKYAVLSAQDTTYLRRALSPMTLQRGEVLLFQEAKCDAIYYVRSGALRSFHRDERGRESTIMFAFQDWWITDMRCFIGQQASDTCIQALATTEVYRLAKPAFDSLFARIPCFNTVFRHLMQNAYIREQTRVFEHLTLPASERHLRLITKYPDLEQLVAQKHIASYLGITPEFLSTLKRKQARPVKS